ncbi:hypothetical protein Q3G72_002710 [Acer saccharum]|nr:hypothetical protein Q3G72_002710 [Acer saccharum]
MKRCGNNTNSTAAHQFSASLSSFVRRSSFRFLSVVPIPNHVVFIMDGNRSYSTKKKLEEGWFCIAHGCRRESDDGCRGKHQGGAFDIQIPEACVSEQLRQSSNCLLFSSSNVARNRFETPGMGCVELSMKPLLFRQEEAAINETKFKL